MQCGRRPGGVSFVANDRPTSGILGLSAPIGQWICIGEYVYVRAVIKRSNFGEPKVEYFVSAPKHMEIRKGERVDREGRVVAATSALDEAGRSTPC